MLRYGRTGLQREAARLLSRLSDLVWPPLSPLSGEEVRAPGELTAADWTDVTFIDAPWCESCGVPFAYTLGPGGICAACAARPRVYSRARAAFVYDDISRALVLQLKHGGRTDALAAFGRWMSRAGRELLEQADGLVPVPLHPRRLRQRRFNQSLLLAGAVSRASGVPLEPHLLQRIKPTPTQGGLSVKGRARNVAGAFRVRAGRADAVAGRHLVLIDDVYTTGATLGACARALRRAGAADVMALTLARVVKPVDPTK